MQSVILRIALYAANFLAILLIIPIHEFAHAFAAVKCGDPTPKLYGRYTLNPFAHFDPLGFLMMALFRFGWAKPVPVNPNNFRNYKKGCVLVSIAGVTANIILAVLLCPLALIADKLIIPAEWAFYLNAFIYYFLQSLFYLNIGLFIFNLLPFYPLDGFRLIDALTVKRGRFYYFLRTKGIFVFLAIILLDFIAELTGIYYINILNVAIDYASWPIEKLWRLILGL